MIEIEVKFPLPNGTAVEENLRALGAIPAGTRHDEDHYFNAPDRDFAQTDEAFRIRRIGPANYLTYKGPKLDAQTKSRRELEVRVGDGDIEALCQLFQHLGYRPVAIVRKERRLYHLARDGHDFECCFDSVEEVGHYVELETIAPDDHYPAAKEALLQLSAELGLFEQEGRSYLRLLLARRGP